MPHQCPTNDEGKRRSGFAVRVSSFVIGGALVGHSSLAEWGCPIPPRRGQWSARREDPMRPLRIAVLDEELPFPPTSGKRIRTFNLLARLADRHRITVLCHRNPDRDEAAAADAAFRRLGVETVVVERAVPPKSGPGFYARLAGNLLSPLPYSVATHASPALAEAVGDLAATGRINLWHCEWTPYAQVLR